jgi:hypothetical protein
MGINNFFKTVGKGTKNTFDTATNTITTNVIDPATTTISPIVDTTNDAVTVVEPLINEATGTIIIGAGNIIGGEAFDNDLVSFINLLRIPCEGSLGCYWVGKPSEVKLMNKLDNSLVWTYTTYDTFSANTSEIASWINFGSVASAGITLSCLVLDLTNITNVKEGPKQQLAVGNYYLYFGTQNSETFTVISPQAIDNGKSVFLYKTESELINVNWTGNGNTTINLMPIPSIKPTSKDILKRPSDVSSGISFIKDTQINTDVNLLTTYIEATINLPIPGLYYLSFNGNQFSNVMTFFVVPEKVSDISIPRIISNIDTVLTWVGGSKVSMYPFYIFEIVQKKMEKITGLTDVPDTEIYIIPTNKDPIQMYGNYNSQIIPKEYLYGEFIFQVGINPNNKFGPFYFIRDIVIDTTAITNNVLTVTWAGGLENIILKSKDRLDTISQSSAGTFEQKGIQFSQSTFDLTNFTQNNLILLFGVEEFLINSTYNVNISSRIISNSPDSTNIVTWSGDTSEPATVTGNGTDITTSNNGNIKSQFMNFIGEFTIQAGAGSKTSFYFIRDIKYKKLSKQIKVTWSGGKETIRLINDETKFQPVVDTLSTTETESGTTNETATIDLTNISAGTYRFNFGGLGNNVSETFKIISPVIS